MKYKIFLIPFLLLMFFGCSEKYSDKDLVKCQAISKHDDSIKLKKQHLFINGYTNKFSYSPGDTLKLFINAKDTVNNFPTFISDLNLKKKYKFYGNYFPQPINNDSSYMNGYGYKNSISIKVPNLKSGIYLFNNLVPFLVKPNKKSNPEIIILYESNTQNAYCKKGGHSLYTFFDKANNRRNHMVSYLRPIKLSKYSEYFFKWMSDNSNYNIGVISDMEMENYENIKNAKLIIITGHSEYWTRKARRNFDKFVNNGKNALILSGNTMWWQVRYNDDKTKMICYKNKLFDKNSVDTLKTINWYQPILKYPILNSIGVNFNYGGYGKKKDMGWDGYKLINTNYPFLKNLPLTKGDVLSIPSMEYDGTKLIFSNDSTSVSIENKNNYHKYELIGYDLASRLPGSNGSWILMQKNKGTGIIINTSSTDWCSKEVMKNGKDSKLIKKITLNMIDFLLEN